MPFPSEQQAAVMAHRARPLIVVAGPGTGKTRTLVERMIGLLAEDQSREVSFITFTRASRRDTHSRLERAFGESVFDQPRLIFPRTSTLHTYAKSLVHRYADAIGRQSNFSMLIENKGEKDLLLRELIEDLQIDIDISVLSEGISCYRCTEEWPYGFPLSPSNRIRVLEHFEELLCFYNTFDMEGIVIAA
jgi:superfamily I DNA/RNA helicase